MRTVSESVVKRLEAQSAAPLFRNQAAAWLHKIANRKRNPVRPRTLQSYTNQLSKNILPHIGQLPLDVVGNAVVKGVVETLVQTGLSAGTIQLNLIIIKQIRASSQNENGEQLYPYTWNTEVIDAPVVDKKAQKRPIASAQAVQDGLSCACASQDTKLLLAVLAGTGMRIQEALAIIRVDAETVFQPYFNYWFPAESKIIVNGQRDKNGFVDTKTPAGHREVDLPVRLNNRLALITQTWGRNLVFNKSEGTYRKTLIKCGIVGGFHSLRRFRVTHLRTEGVPDPIVHFWVGHEDKTVTDGYTIVKTEIQKRKDWVEKVGLGFTLPEAI